MEMWSEEMWALEAREAMDIFQARKNGGGGAAPNSPKRRLKGSKKAARKLKSKKAARKRSPPTPNTPKRRLIRSKAARKAARKGLSGPRQPPGNPPHCVVLSASDNDNAEVSKWPIAEIITVHSASPPTDNRSPKRPPNTSSPPKAGAAVVPLAKGKGPSNSYRQRQSKQKIERAKRLAVEREEEDARLAEREDARLANLKLLEREDARLAELDRSLREIAREVHQTNEAKALAQRQQTLREKALAQRQQILREKVLAQQQKSAQRQRSAQQKARKPSIWADKSVVRIHKERAAHDTKVTIVNKPLPTESLGVLLTNSMDITYDLDKQVIKMADYAIDEWPSIFDNSNGARKQFNTTVSNGNHMGYTVGKRIASGSFGSVDELNPNGAGPKYVIKTITGKKPNEMSINDKRELLYVGEEAFRTVMVSAMVIKKEKRVVMQKAIVLDRAWARNTSIQTYSNICQLARGLYQLQEMLIQQGYFQFDMKAANCGLIPTEKGTRLVLLDYGALCPLSPDDVAFKVADEEYGCMGTFVLPEFGYAINVKRGMYGKATEKTAMWLAAMTAMQLLRFNVPSIPNDGNTVISKFYWLARVDGKHYKDDPAAVEYTPQQRDAWLIKLSKTMATMDDCFKKISTWVLPNPSERIC